jgi:HEAT repeat protein
MTRLFPILATFTIPGAILAAAPEAEPQASTAKAWTILEQGLASKRAAKRVSATNVLRLLPHDPRAQQMAARALTDPRPEVRAAGARTFGSMETVSSVPKLKTALNDKEPGVVLAAAHSALSAGRNSRRRSASTTRC